MSSPVVQVHFQRAPGDCAMCALASYLGVSYEDVLTAAVKTTKSSKVHRNGMFIRDIKRTAERLGVKLRLRRSFDLEYDEGILSLASLDGKDEHVAFVKCGVIVDNADLWFDADSYLAHRKFKPVSLLVRKDQ